MSESHGLYFFSSSSDNLRMSAIKENAFLAIKLTVVHQFHIYIYIYVCMYFNLRSTALWAFSSNPSLYIDYVSIINRKHIFCREGWNTGGLNLFWDFWGLSIQTRVIWVTTQLPCVPLSLTHTHCHPGLSRGLKYFLFFFHLSLETSKPHERQECLSH